jgi:hypothetical protein
MTENTMTIEQILALLEALRREMREGETFNLNHSKAGVTVGNNRYLEGVSWGFGASGDLVNRLILRLEVEARKEKAKATP